MASVALVRTDVSDELSASVILHSHRRENLKSYIAGVVVAEVGTLGKNAVWGVGGSTL
jgi:hypothetical protein